MTFEIFLRNLLGAFDRECIQCCVLRNYEKFPAKNVGNDIDILIRPRDIGRAVTTIARLPGLRETDFAQRPYVLNMFVAGVGPDESFAIQIDLMLSLTWKGLEYLDPERVFAAAQRRNTENVSFLIPSPVHEAIISLMSSYLIGGWIKQKYQAGVIEQMAADPGQSAAELSPAFGTSLSRELICAVTQDDQIRMLRMLPRLRRALLKRSVARRPVATVLAVARHFATEIYLRFTPVLLQDICVLGPDGAGKTSVLSGALEVLRNSSKQICVEHLRPRWSSRAGSTVSIVEDPHGKPLRSAFTSTAKIVLWLAVAWIDRFCSGNKVSRLRLWDRYYHDLLIDPRRYRYGGPMWLARLVGRMMPQPQLWILLDAPAEVLQARKREVSFEETARQRQAYREFVGQQPNGIIIDAAQPLDRVIGDVKAAILNCMEERTVARIALACASSGGER
jgi:thymidylate kinase